VDASFNLSKSSNPKDTNPKEKAKRVVIESILKGNTTGKSVFVSPTPLGSGTVIKVKKRRRLSVPATKNATKLWFFFIDDDPGSNLEEHPCRYVLVDDEGQWIVFSDSLPPDMLSQMERIA